MTKGAQKMVSRFYTLPLPTPNRLFPAPIESKSVFAALWGGGIHYFQPVNHFPTDTTLQASPYYITISMGNVFTGYIP